MNLNGCEFRVFWKPSRAIDGLFVRLVSDGFAECRRLKRFCSRAGDQRTKEGNVLA